jgi:hypothetical protein
MFELKFEAFKTPLAGGLDLTGSLIIIDKDELEGVKIPVRALS